MDIVLLILCILPFGFDKLYKKDTLMFVCKLISSFFIVGFIWWIYDIVMCVLKKYEVRPWPFKKN